MSRRGSASSYSTRHHDRVFRKREKNPAIVWCLVMGDAVLMRSSDRDALVSFKARNRFTGTTIERRDW